MDVHASTTLHTSLKQTGDVNAVGPGHLLRHVRWLLRVECVGLLATGLGVVMKIDTGRMDVLVRTMNRISLMQTAIVDAVQQVRPLR
jgi:hypothetical protein